MQPKSYPLLSREQLSHVLSRTSPHSFEFNIRKMNAMYKLPINTEPTLDRLHKPNGDPETAIQRMMGFLSTLCDECAEGDEIQFKLRFIDLYDTPQEVRDSPGYRGLEFLTHGLLQQARQKYEQVIDGEKIWTKLHAFNTLCAANLTEAKEDVLTDIADWLGDIMVYCRSEAMKYGLPLENALEAIMGSNFTKLPSDGIPKHDVNGKFLKDMTNFVPPEPAIKTILFGLDPKGADRASLQEKAEGPAHPYSKIDQLDAGSSDPV
jgi:hypothetical protein